MGVLLLVLLVAAAIPEAALWDEEDASFWRREAEAALDAALDVLESSPSNDDWKLLTDALLAVLRESGKGDS